ncbi:regulator of sigma-E protease RseP [bacterium BMS3Bbin12]|nr:regulator of sigma-E protease RseP [bacterium BMS3Abin12]GBE48409.1 regulator of sigma-E protease RseP [bacterium BMS3Bbin12]GBE50554.1 regulator of sigma-E protease RseP [bacterium BMS3Bbin13]HDK03353.1 RIP metalloprotease RseP [Gammaproteobacteria bacterium]
MIHVLFYLAAFTVAISVLVTVHEFGHFWVARRLGVKVLRFSIGFGKPLWTWHARRDGTEYVVAALPLGGYVKMLDEHEAPVPAEDRGRAFNRKPIATRAAVVVAGPLFNLLLAVLAYWITFVVGMVGARPLIGAVVPGSPAALAGVQAREEIVAVDGRPTPTWNTARFALLDAALGNRPADLKLRTPAGHTVRRVLSATDSGSVLKSPDLWGAVGIKPWRPAVPAVIGRLVPGDPAATAGLRPGDRVVAVDGRAVKDWAAMAAAIRARPGQRMRVTVERGGVRRTVVLRTAQIAGAQGAEGRIGVYPRVPKGLFDQLRVTVRYGPIEALIHAMDRTAGMTVRMLRILARMFTGEASVRNISGPITIAQYAGESASIGLIPFLGFLAVVSISLGVLNLLPIPILDGGHLLYYLVEAVKGSPVSEHVQAVGQRIGILLLLLLMSLAFYNDLRRLFIG